MINQNNQAWRNVCQMLQQLTDILLHSDLVPSIFSIVAPTH